MKPLSNTFFRSGREVEPPQERCHRSPQFLNVNICMLPTRELFQFSFEDIGNWIIFGLEVRSSPLSILRNVMFSCCHTLWDHVLSVVWHFLCCHFDGLAFLAMGDDLLLPKSLWKSHHYEVSKLRRWTWFLETDAV